MKKIGLAVLFFLMMGQLLADDGHQLWLRYDPVEEEALRADYISQIQNFNVPGEGATFDLIREELGLGLEKMLLSEIAESQTEEASLLVVLSDHTRVSRSDISKETLSSLGEEGYLIRSNEQNQILLTANTPLGLYYGTFHFLRRLQTRQSINDLDIVSVPKVETRMLNHWDNLDRTSERGYAGFAIWDWHRLPDYLDPIYAEYARANASLGINATVPINVNSNALILTPMYLEKVKALADVFRPYGIKMYLTARFSAPVQIGGLKTADPLDPAVANWWKEKVDEIYEYVPDFGGFLVKANSEGQPGPHDYGRNHADGANMMAKALAPHGGKVIWRAFVYSEENPEDRHKQANDQFVPLDGQFEDNVLIQVKNGAIDFQPREPFHPLFGAMNKTNLAMEFQITQEYLGQATQLVFMGPYYKECLDSDTGIKNKNSLVSDVIDGSAYQQKHTLMAGVANIGTDRNWTGHLFGQSNWYAFGRLAWDPDISAQQIADEWVKMTFGADKKVEETIKSIMMESREAAVNYMTPLGLHHLMATGHHYGPGPWVSNLGRPEWNPVYYHRADKEGIGFDRTESGSNAIGQYNKSVAKRFSSLKTCPEKYLLWFHHVSWDYQMQSGNILWDELALRYQQGVNQVRDFKSQWATLEGKVDDGRFEHVRMLLNIQEKEAIWWKDSSLLYFQTFSERAFPDGIEKPKGTLDYYKNLRFPLAPGIRPQW
ncbi:alpha-glucuronidase family glycosyl hydrolase [Reichenbachiella ulvae]|uniref:Xylan alpha-1,2-glucuronidase n=1 Tax=Reichenbachiella ulvae TaxID=2980104 RepID=A0ABT3CU35_9BACT|nr:alpha-glucuronidase family glycosyl hydrolase [Reichenbachiella ulvae]MCV9387064.1 alpha-glucuronidase [Reichenbachiella ulvae]